MLLAARDSSASWIDSVSWILAALQSSCSYSVCLPLKKGILARFFFLFVMPLKSATLPLILCECGTVSLWHRNSRFPAPRPLPHFSCEVIQRSAMTDWARMNAVNIKPRFQKLHCLCSNLLRQSLNMYLCNKVINLLSFSKQCRFRLKYSKVNIIRQ